MWSRYTDVSATGLACGAALTGARRRSFAYCASRETGNLGPHPAAFMLRTAMRPGAVETPQIRVAHNATPLA